MCDLRFSVLRLGNFGVPNVCGLGLFKKLCGFSISGSFIFDLPLELTNFDLINWGGLEYLFIGSELFLREKLFGVMLFDTFWLKISPGSFES
jgi:hypothetical protein